MNYSLILLFTYSSLATGADRNRPADTPPYSISGVIRSGDKTPLVDIPVTLSGGTSQVVKTNSIGVYTFQQLDPAKNYIITPVQSGVTFVPPLVIVSTLETNVSYSFEALTSQSQPAVEVTPQIAGSGRDALLSLNLTDPNGSSDIAFIQVLVNSIVSSEGACKIHFERATSQIWLLNDGTDGWIGPGLLGSSHTLTNSQCTLDTAGSAVAVSDFTLNLTLAFKYTSSFAGARTIYVHVQDNESLSSGWQQAGAWSVDP